MTSPDSSAHLLRVVAARRNEVARLIAGDVAAERTVPPQLLVRYRELCDLEDQAARRARVDALLDGQP